MYVGIYLTQNFALLFDFEALNPLSSQLQFGIAAQQKNEIFSNAFVSIKICEQILSAKNVEPWHPANAAERDRKIDIN
jgi:hypothetical protein